MDLTVYSAVRTNQMGYTMYSQLDVDYYYYYSPCTVNCYMVKSSSSFIPSCLVSISAMFPVSV